ncbi:MAG TPA: SPOR domain-containing protein, partial [Gemmatimonadaceae bacterium]|nr:SPOR domain-containing protein [Gemmatimonadaceae bacterium]
RGVPGRLDLRIRSAEPAAGAPLAGLASADGWAIYGLTAKREVSRLTPSGTWTFRPDRAPAALLPIADGSLVLISDDGRRTQLRRLHPPEPRVTDSASVPHSELMMPTDIGDRIYFLGDSGLAGVRIRDLARTKTIKLPSRASDAVATPSGDRIFVSLRGRKAIVVIDRFTEQIDRTIDLGSEAIALRMDPDGQYVLVREAVGDSVSIVSIATSRAVARVRSAWRTDLPLVGPDGHLALAQDRDVVILDTETRRELARYAGGVADLWALIRWNGFRPRAAVLDEPVRFASDTEATPARARTDSALASVIAGLSPGALATVTHPPESSALPADPRKSGGPGKRAFTLSFAAMLSEDRANTLAAAIKVDGKPVRVVPSTREGTPVFRVVFGPFDSREEAERTGRRTGLPFWVYEGAP